MSTNAKITVPTTNHQSASTSLVHTTVTVNQVTSPMSPVNHAKTSMSVPLDLSLVLVVKNVKMSKVEYLVMNVYVLKEKLKICWEFVLILINVSSRLMIVERMLFALIMMLGLIVNVNRVTKNSTNPLKPVQTSTNVKKKLISAYQTKDATTPLAATNAKTSTLVNLKNAKPIKNVKLSWESLIANAQNPVSNSISSPENATISTNANGFYQQHAVLIKTVLIHQVVSVVLIFQ